MKILLIILIFISSFANFSGVKAKEEKLPGLGIENTCDTKFPIEQKNSYNQPQYKLGHERCINAYTLYKNALDLMIKDWTAAKENNPQEWEKVLSDLDNLYEITISYGEMLIDWSNRDSRLSDIVLYQKYMQKQLDIAKMKDGERFWDKVVFTGIISIKTNDRTITSSGVSSLTGVVLPEVKNVCKKGFSFNIKNGKCKKIFNNNLNLKNRYKSL